MQTPSWGLGAWRQGGANPYWGHDVEGHDVEGDLVRSPSPCQPPFFPFPGTGTFSPLTVTAIPTVHYTLRSTLPSHYLQRGARRSDISSNGRPSAQPHSPTILSHTWTPLPTTMEQLYTTKSQTTDLRPGSPRGKKKRPDQNGAWTYLVVWLVDPQIWQSGGCRTLFLIDGNFGV